MNIGSADSPRLQWVRVATTPGWWSPRRRGRGRQVIVNELGRRQLCDHESGAPDNRVKGTVRDLLIARCINTAGTNEDTALLPTGCVLMSPVHPGSHHFLRGQRRLGGWQQRPRGETSVGDDCGIAPMVLREHGSRPHRLMYETHRAIPRTAGRQVTNDEDHRS